MHKIKVFDSLKCRRTDYIVMLLFFALLIVGFVFACTDAEYEYNQQIARGFISREAVFFSFDNLSYQEPFYSGAIYFSELETDEPIFIDTTPKAAVDESFVLENKLQDNGQTAVETLLMSGSGSYLASLHNGLMRGVVYKGSVLLPPLLSGRFFTEEECLADHPLAVIGSNYKESLVARNGKQYLEYRDRDYEVIGIVGLSAASPIDDVVFVNLGSLTPSDQLNGIFYIDCSDGNERVFSELEEQSEHLFGCGLKLRETPKAFIDVVAGGMYMKSYLKILTVLLGLTAFLSVLIQSVREMSVEIVVMKIVGIRLRKVFFITMKKKLIAFAFGMISGAAVDAGLIVFGVFSLPVNWLIRYGTIMIAAGFVLMIIWILTVFVIEWRMNPKEVIQKI